jgi:hypothetical protein
MTQTNRQSCYSLAAVAGAALCILGACNPAPSDQTVHAISDVPATPAQRVAQERTVLPPGQPAASQQTFATPDEAVQALLLASESKDHAEMKSLFGPAGKDFVSGDPISDQNDFNSFVDAIGERATLAEIDPNTCVLHIGKKAWAFPIPIAKTKDGKWYFDTVAGETEILARRIGRNELQAIAICRTYLDAQREYASEDRDGDGVLQYAQRLNSSDGKKDGLYWKSDQPLGMASATSSPFGPLVAEAGMEGYGPISGSKKSPTAYHGYYFHILKGQGPHAPGGAYSYVINDKMIAGFALVAYPAEYGKSGIMTFVISHQGKVFEKDLGAKTDETVKAMDVYDPDKTWTAATE